MSRTKRKKVETLPIYTVMDDIDKIIKEWDKPNDLESEDSWEHSKITLMRIKGICHRALRDGFSV